MNRMSYIVGTGLLSAASLARLAHGDDGHKHEQTPATTTTIVGELIDTGCFVSSDGDAKGKEHAECATKCLATGVPAGILPEGKTKTQDALFLLTNPAPLAPYAAQTIKVEGVVHAGNHAFDVKKAWVKDGTAWKEIELKDAHHGSDAHGEKDHQHGTGGKHEHK